ncbi:MAG: hypothetical protein QF662_03985, partial [Phycisphaerae bacterium]|nr:hypothetical protein [Phycisphaerae bacterium]
MTVVGVLMLIVILLLVLGVLYFFVVWVYKKGVKKVSFEAPEVTDVDIARTLGEAKMFDNAGDYQAALHQYSDIVTYRPEAVQPRFEFVRAFILTNFPDNWRDAQLVLDETDQYIREDRDRLVAAYLKAFLETLLGHADIAAGPMDEMQRLLAAGVRAAELDIIPMAELITVSG